MPPELYSALSQVREIHARVIERQRFRGYSGRARILSGILALAAAAYLSRSEFAGEPVAHLSVWGALAVTALALNLAAVFRWYFVEPESRGDFRRLKPLLEAMVPLAVGSMVTVALINGGELRAILSRSLENAVFRYENFDVLFGIWMCFFGLANFAGRDALPRQSQWLGWFYLACGTVLLFAPNVKFVNPWPMGIVFFAGEITGGLIFHHIRHPGENWLTVILPRRKAEATDAGVDDGEEYENEV